MRSVGEEGISRGGWARDALPVQAGKDGDEAEAGDEGARMGLLSMMRSISQRVSGHLILRRMRVLRML